jgi:CRISPR-associated protein Cas2
MTELHVVVAYDIPDDRRRLKIAKVLLGYGERVQYSVFECRVTKVEYLRMKEKLDELIEPEEDAVSFYFLCEGCRGKIERIGGRKLLPEDVIFIGWDEEGL